MSSDLLDQLAAYGAQQRRAQPPLELDGVIGDRPSALDADAERRTPNGASTPTAERTPPGRRRLVTLTAAAMVGAVVGLIAFVSVVRDGPTDVVSPGPAADLEVVQPVELFRVNSDAAAYWRLTTLLEYGGEEFRLPRRSLERIDGEFASGTAGNPRIRQQVQILSLEGRLVPAAAEPVQAAGSSGGTEISLTLNRDTSTLVAVRDLVPGDLFTIVSSMTQPTPDELRAATTEPPDPILVEVPADLPTVMGELAVDVTIGAATSYDSAVALQNWFRSEFEHRAGAIDGHSADDLDEFLDVREGDAEQFSAAFALMARTLGLPTRVAVGYTPGVLNQEGWYSVTDAQSHSWPEVWFDDIGWIPFEPTPGRGIPGAEPATGVPTEQDERTATSSP
ncbi:transglutaminase-like domain-containing protein [Ilumatobacter sp.]|uniref:transglutaminase-like domain-containing protein n=1 Tax=Ilumatobacter sp. TaxID=1967498 RepID=UPI003AF9BCB2